MDKPRDPMIGSTISHYRVLKKLGGGGMGIVYEAEDTKLHRHVALKFLSDHLSSNPQALERFRREARAASALNHPNICTIYEINDASARIFIAMELLEGQLLKELISDQPLPTKRLIELALDVTEALEAAHSEGLLHRDLKPANIFVTSRYGRAKILDFGLAKPALEPVVEGSVDRTSSRDLTSTGATVGTVNYMSPEQVRGEPLDVTSDLFSLGAVLYEMATGRPCFPGKTWGLVLDSVLNRKPVSARGLNPNIPRRLEQIIFRLIDKNPTRRYPSAQALAADLMALRQELDSGSSARVRAEPPVKREPKIVSSIAVLPFENATRDPNNEYISDGITESIIDMLSRLPDLRVMARSTVFRHKNTAADPIAIGRELGVNAVMTGRVSQVGDRIVIRAELVDVAKGWQLWGEQYGREMRDIFEVQEEIASEISSKLQLKLSADEKKRIRKRPTEDASAYKLYLKGRYCWHKRGEDQVRTAITHFQEAIRLDPSYARAYSGLADCYATLSFVLSGNPKEHMPKARAAAAKALEIDAGLAEAHASRAMVIYRYDWNFAEAEKEFRKAIELSPGYAAAHQWYGECLTAMERFEESVAELQRTLELDPLSPISNAVLAGMHFFARHYEAAIEQSGKSLELDQNFWPALLFRGMAYEQTKDFAQAEKTLSQALDVSRRSSMLLAAAGHAYASAGERGMAEKLLGELCSPPANHYVAPVYPAIVATGLGDLKLAFDELQRAVRERSGWLVFLRVDPRFDVLRGDARFQQILDDMARFSETVRDSSGSAQRRAG
jgi:serine/threonine protein kinase/Tfp pilus assembly protein PilF